MFEHTSEAPA